MLLALLAALIPVTTVSPQARALFEQGRALGDANRWEEAHDKFDQAVKLDPSFALARAYEGFSMSGAEGQALLDRAAADAQKLPETERMLIEQMDAEFRGEHERARNLALRLAMLAPDDWRAQQLKGRVEVHSGNFASAEQALLRATQLSPKALPPWNSLAYARMRQGNLEGAILAAKRTVALRPGEANPLDTLAEMQLAANRFADAEATFQRALAVDAQFWLAGVGVAQSRFLRAEWEQGRAAALHAVSIAPPIEQPRIAALSAWSRLAEGDRAQALHALDELSQSMPGNARAGAIASVDRALMFAVERDAAGAVREGHLALQAMAKLELAGDDREQLSRYAWRALALGHSVRHEEADAQAALEELLESVRRAPLSRAAQAAVFHARAEIAAANGDLERALTALDACAGDQWCRLRRVELLDAAHDPRAAAERTALLARPWRDQIQFGEPPFYLYAHARLSGAHSAIEASSSSGPR